MGGGGIILYINPIDPIKGLVNYYATFLAAHRLFRQFKPKVSLFFEKGNYYVKTAETWAELEGALKLRYEVFQCEFKNRKLQPGFDTDRFDVEADHLIIVNKKSGKVVGCYRFISSCYSSQFYSATEFDISSFLALPGVKLELSRACIHREFRTGQVMHLLWRGLVNYWEAIGAKYLFGCSSVKATDAEAAAQIYRYCESKGFVDEALQAPPLAEYELPGFEEARRQTEGPGVEPDLPPLLSAYFKTGAKIAALPALDRDFQCIDFFTVLKLSDLDASYGKRYAAS